MIEQGNIKPPEERKKNLKWYRRIDLVAKIEMFISTKYLIFGSFLNLKVIRQKIKYMGLHITAYAVQYYINKGMMHFPQMPNAKELMDNLTGYIEKIDVMDNDEIKVVLVINNPYIRKIIENKEFVHFTIKGKENDNKSLH